MKKFIKYYFLLNCIYVAILSFIAYIFDKKYYFLIQGLFLSFFSKINILINIFSFSKLSILCILYFLIIYFMYKSTEIKYLFLLLFILSCFIEIYILSENFY